MGLVILYNAGQAATYGYDVELRDRGCRHRLLTFAEIDTFQAGTFRLWVEEPPVEGQEVFVDSGAFGAFSRGASIDLDRYCGYLLDHRSGIGAYAALDVIRDWRGSAANLKAMRARGLDPIPTFHRGSPWDVLVGLAADHGYLALGGVVSDRAGGTEGMRGWLDECWCLLGAAWPIKVHAFGITAQWALERYPFYSVDSSAAIVGGAMGRVMRWDRGRIVQRPWAEDLMATLDGSVADGVEVQGTAHMARRHASVAAARSLERYATDLWASKGVRWDS